MPQPLGSSHSGIRAGKTLGDIANQKDQDPDPGQLVLITHSVRLSNPHEQGETHIGAAERLQNFAQ
jgi:hypothetical protein